MSGRWIAVSVDALHAQHELHPNSTGEEACKGFAWIDLIGLAAWKPHGGLKRGEVRAGQNFLATRWNWHRSKVRRFLNELEERGSIERANKQGRQPTIITIRNYDTYQSPRPANRPTDRPTNRPQAVPLPLPPSKRSRAKNGNNGRKPPRPAVDMRDAYAAPEKIRDILDGLKRKVGEQ